MERGDGLLIVLPFFATRVNDFLRELNAGLRVKNQTLTQGEEIRLRVALHHGTVMWDASGWVGGALVTASRLVKAAPLRHALNSAPDALLAIIASESAYQDLLVDRYPPEGLGFAPVIAEVKEFRARAWVRVPGYPYPPGIPRVSEESGDQAHSKGSKSGSALGFFGSSRPSENFVGNRKEDYDEGDR
ncbi:hypothetical protein [Micromonospora zamorensis]|uniref:hypothetical protein n=1 Tax=Micromonospora zamorensis TaxID=709883 RepID=UPI002E2E42D4|nr:hypothetical protein [Micromonospora zamorensis]